MGPSRLAVAQGDERQVEELGYLQAVRKLLKHPQAPFGRFSVILVDRCFQGLSQRQPVFFSDAAVSRGEVIETATANDRLSPGGKGRIGYLVEGVLCGVFFREKRPDPTRW